MKWFVLLVCVGAQVVLLTLHPGKTIDRWTPLMLVPTLVLCLYAIGTVDWMRRLIRDRRRSRARNER